MPRVPPQNAAGFLQFLDVSVGAEVAALCTRGGRPAAMAQNPASGVVHLGHGNGTAPPLRGDPPPIHRDPPPSHRDPPPNS